LAYHTTRRRQRLGLDMVPAAVLGEGDQPSESQDNAQLA
jgi:hypothetical protein